MMSPTLEAGQFQVSEHGRDAVADFGGWAGQFQISEHGRDAVVDFGRWAVLNQ